MGKKRHLEIRDESLSTSRQTWMRSFPLRAGPVCEAFDATTAWIATCANRRRPWSCDYPSTSGGPWKTCRVNRGNAKKASGSMRLVARLGQDNKIFDSETGTNGGGWFLTDGRTRFGGRTARAVLCPWRNVDLSCHSVIHGRPSLMLAGARLQNGQKRW